MLVIVLHHTLSEILQVPFCDLALLFYFLFIMIQKLDLAVTACLFLKLSTNVFSISSISK